MLARITLTSSPDLTRSEAIAAARENRATAMQVLEIRNSLQRRAKNGIGIARSEARRALELADERSEGVRW
ncbi:hypothetical protein [Paraburkholderia acidisoli]|uniref:Uncharacterized protein n=1 Tax=Paraburkholderia acidisoli TaxID=2571748 RepID=A0A7Z2JH74_9BURK|nr:hypothetical protein [Paraburkholderia acidisoli]QGZ63773.1 hypothetical protein FAZ98_18610 [Paraburkholderia acidisoli]